MIVLLICAFTFIKRKNMDGSGAASIPKNGNVWCEMYWPTNNEINKKYKGGTACPPFIKLGVKSESDINRKRKGSSDQNNEYNPFEYPNDSQSEFSSHIKYLCNSGYAEYNHLTIQFEPIKQDFTHRGIVNALFEYYAHVYCTFRLLGYYDVLFQSDANINTIDAYWDTYQDNIQSLSYYKDNCELMFTRNPEMINLYIRYVFEAIFNVLSGRWLATFIGNSIQFYMGSGIYVDIGQPKSKDGTSYNWILSCEMKYNVKIGSTSIEPISSIYQPICKSEYILNILDDTFLSKVSTMLREYYNVKSGHINADQTIVDHMNRILINIRCGDKESLDKLDGISKLASFITDPGRSGSYPCRDYGINFATRKYLSNLSNLKNNRIKLLSIRECVNKMHDCMADICKNSTISNKILIRIIMVLLLDILNKPQRINYKDQSVQFDDIIDDNIKVLKQVFPNQVNV